MMRGFTHGPPSGRLQSTMSLTPQKTEVDSADAADAADKHESAERIGSVQGPQKVLQKLKWTEFIFVSVS